MRNRHKLVFVLTAGVFFLLFACKTTQPQTPPPEEAPAAAPAAPAAPEGLSQAVLNDLNGAIARAGEARKRASDFESGSYFPSDWENAEAEYASAERLPRNDDAAARQAASRYTALADTYDGIFKRAIPLYVQDREDEIVALRNEVLETGLSDTFPDYLLDVDRVAVQALTQYEEEDYYGALDTWTLARDRYQVLKTGGDAYNTRMEIAKRGFIAYDPDNFARAEEIGGGAVDAYEAGNIADALNGAEEAGLRYNLALKTAWTAYTAERKLAAETERQSALDLKANVAVKAEFDAASAVYSQAGSSLQAEDYESAAALYTESEAQFTEVGRIAAEKRRDAEDAIREAEQKVLESEENAKNAELILEGGES